MKLKAFPLDLHIHTSENVDDLNECYDIVILIKRHIKSFC